MFPITCLKKLRNGKLRFLYFSWICIIICRRALGIQSNWRMIITHAEHRSTRRTALYEIASKFTPLQRARLNFPSQCPLCEICHSWISTVKDCDYNDRSRQYPFGIYMHIFDITKTPPCNIKQFFMAVKIKIFSRFFLFSYFCSKHRLWEHVRTASVRRF